jgi:hypothetical protein
MGAFASVLMFTANICGGTLYGWMHESDDEAWERKMKARAVRRRPLEETIAEIGEGRGTAPKQRSGTSRALEFANSSCRHQSPRIRGATSAETQGEVRY